MFSGAERLAGYKKGRNHYMPCYRLIKEVNYMRQLLEIEMIPIKIETKMTYGKFQPSEDPSKNLSAYKDSLNQTVRAANSVEPAEMSADTKPAVSKSSAVEQPRISDVYRSGQMQAISSYEQAKSLENSAALSANRRENVVSADFMKAGIQNVAVSNAAQSGFAYSSNSAVSSTFPEGSQSAGAIAYGVMEAYEMERANFQASLESGVRKMEYIPGSVEFDVVQNPEVNFTYTGGFIYVPRSAAPDYVDTSA
jgi:hypothetical protein